MGMYGTINDHKLGQHESEIKNDTHPPRSTLNTQQQTTTNCHWTLFDINSFSFPVLIFECI